MKTNSSYFFGIPHTQIGWWAVGISLLFTILFLLVTNDLLAFSGFLTISFGVIAGLLDLLAVIWKRERSWMLWLMLVPGLFAILFTLGEVLFPH